MINIQMIELLLMFSVAVWALLSKTPVKALAKMLAHRIFPTYLKYGDWLRLSKDVYVFEQYVVKFFAALIAIFLIGLAQVIDIAMITDNLSTEWQWLENAELISALGVISLIPVKYSLLYYVDLLLTVALIGVVGSAGVHRLEKWISGNALLFDVLRQWLLTSGQAGDLGTARGKITFDNDARINAAAADKLPAASESAIKAHKGFIAEHPGVLSGQSSPEAVARAKQLGFISDELRGHG